MCTIVFNPDENKYANGAHHSFNEYRVMKSSFGDKSVPKSGYGTGAIIIIAYPESPVKMIPRWYEPLLRLIGVVRGGFICAGHAALLLVDRSNGETFYADFDRYIVPDHSGRTRTRFTDPDVDFKLKAKLSSQGKIVNLEAMLEAISRRSAQTHGSGIIYASTNCEVDYDKAYRFIMSMNKKGSMLYDPFKKHGSNCARFVNGTLLASISPKRIRRLEKRTWPTASPLGNVFFGGEEPAIILEDGKFKPHRGSRIWTIIQYFFRNSAPPPKTDSPGKNLRHKNMHWLGGIGCGAYFKIQPENGKSGEILRIDRFDVSGKRVFSRTYSSKGAGINTNTPHRLTHDANAQVVNIEQNGVVHLYRVLPRHEESTAGN